MSNFAEVRINTSTRDNATPQDSQSDFNAQAIMEQVGSAGYEVGTNQYIDGRVRSAQADTQTGPGVLGSARTPGGFPTMHVNAASIVTLPNGMQTTAKVAAGLGYLKGNGDGTFSDIAPAASDSNPQAQPQAQQQSSPQVAPQEVNTLPMDPQTTEFISSMATHLGGKEVLDKFADAVIAGMGADSAELDGKNHLTGKFLSQFAQDHGMKLSTAQAAAQAIIDGYTAHAASYLNLKSGGRGQEILEWAKGEYHPESHQEVLRLHWHGSMNGYDALFTEWSKKQLSKAGRR